MRGKKLLTDCSKKSPSATKAVIMDLYLNELKKICTKISRKLMAQLSTSHKIL